MSRSRGRLNLMEYVPTHTKITLDFETEHLERLKVRSEKTCKTLSELVNDAVAAYLATHDRRLLGVGEVNLPVCAGKFALPGIDYNSNASMWDAMEDPDDEFPPCF